MATQVDAGWKRKFKRGYNKSRKAVVNFIHNMKFDYDLRICKKKYNPHGTVITPSLEEIFCRRYFHG